MDICFLKFPTGPSFPHSSTYHVSENGPHHPHKVAEVTERVHCRGNIAPLWTGLKRALSSHPKLAGHEVTTGSFKLWANLETHRNTMCRVSSKVTHIQVIYTVKIRIEYLLGRWSLLQRERDLLCPSLACPSSYGEKRELKLQYCPTYHRATPTNLPCPTPRRFLSLETTRVESPARYVWFRGDGQSLSPVWIWWGEPAKQQFSSLTNFALAITYLILQLYTFIKKVIIQQLTQMHSIHNML